jgi:hypothetical protein
MFFQNTNSGTTAADGLFVGINSGNDAFFYNAEATPARFFTSAIERMRITASGDVGIGTASPASILHLRASSATFTIDDSGDGTSKISFRPAERAFMSVNYGTAEMRIAAGVSGGAYFQSFYTNGTERLRIFANGRVFVGASPTDAGYQFDVNGSLRAGSVIMSTNSPFYTGANLYASANFGIGTNTANILGFFTNSTERILITSTGSVTISNLAGSGARLVVADASGNLSATTLSSSVTTGSGTTNYITKWTGASALGNSQIIDNGNIGIGDVPLDKFTITVDQNSTVTGRIRNTSTGSSAYSQWAVNASGNSWGLRMGSSAANSNALDIVSDALGTPAIRMRYFTNGRIGVNTTTDAGYQLDVNGSIRAIGLIRSQATVGNTNGYFQLEHPGSQTWKLGLFTDNASTFSIGNDNGGVFASRYLNITNVGDIGIATTSPSYKLDINGTLRSVNGANFATTSGNVGIGTASPVASAKLDITSTTQGFLPPRMTATQRAAITSPAVGLVVYQSDGNEGLWIYTNANGWKALAIVV